MHIVRIKAGLLTIKEFCKWSGIGRSRTYKFIADGSLAAIKIGKSTRIPSSSALAWLTAQSAYPIQPDAAERSGK